jgi:two-component system nitrate/nitrite response regulator NarL
MIVRQIELGSVLVGEDDDRLRALIVHAFEQEGFATAAVADGTEALEAARVQRPLLAVLDVNLPGASGYEVCRLLREAYGLELPIILISGERTESFDRVAGLLIGADDYLVKPFVPEELLARARGLLRRAGWNGHARRPLSLTARELEILRLLADGRPQREIAEGLVISPKTVGTHIERILGKLGVHSRAQAVAFAYREGIVRTPA